MAALSKACHREVETLRRAIADTRVPAAPSPLHTLMSRSNTVYCRCPKVSGSFHPPTCTNTVLFSKRNSEIGRLWSSEHHLNLISEYQLERYGIGIVKTNTAKFLCDRDGTQFPLHVVNSKYVIPVGRYSSSGRFHTATFIVDGGSPFHIVSAADSARIGFQPGGGNVCVSGFGGSTSDLTCGSPWFAVLRDVHGCWRAPSTQLTCD